MSAHSMHHHHAHIAGMLVILLVAGLIAVAVVRVLAYLVDLWPMAPTVAEPTMVLLAPPPGPLT